MYQRQEIIFWWQYHRGQSEMACSISTDSIGSIFNGAEAITKITHWSTPRKRQIQIIFPIYVTHLIKFLLRIRGALTAAPTRELPVSQMPQAAPTTEKPKPKAIPKFAHPYGDKWERSSPHPWLQYGELQRSDMVAYFVERYKGLAMTPRRADGTVLGGFVAAFGAGSCFWLLVLLRCLLAFQCCGDRGSSAIFQFSVVEKGHIAFFIILSTSMYNFITEAIKAIHMFFPFVSLSYRTLVTNNWYFLCGVGKI